MWLSLIFHVGVSGKTPCHLMLQKSEFIPIFGMLHCNWLLQSIWTRTDVLAINVCIFCVLWEAGWPPNRQCARWTLIESSGWLSTTIMPFATQMYTRVAGKLLLL